MTAGRVIKALLLVILVVAAVDLASPLLTKRSVHDAATQAADAGAHQLLVSHDTAKARDAAAWAAGARSAHLEAFTFETTDRVTVKVFRHARSVVLDRIPGLGTWYDLRATASAVPH